MKLWMALAAAVLACAQVSAADLRDGLNSYESKDYALAFGILAPLAELGNPRAQFAVSRLLLDGKGIDKDVVRGVGWLIAAAENGSPDASGVLAAESAKRTDAQKSEAQLFAARYGREATALLNALPTGAGVVDGFKPPQVTPGLEKNTELQRGMALVMAQSGWMFTDVICVVDAEGQVRDAFIVDSQPTRNISQLLVEALHGIRWTPAQSAQGPVPGAMLMSVHYMFQQTNAARQLRNNILRLKREAQDGDDASQYVLSKLEHYFKELPGGDIDADALLSKAAAQGRHARAMHAQAIKESKDTVNPAASDFSRLLEVGRAGLQPVQIEIALAAWSEQTPAGYARARRWLAAARNGGGVEANKYLAALLVAHPVKEAEDTKSALKLAGDATTSWHGTKDPDAWQVLAAAQAKAGQFAEAITAQQKAIDLARGYGWTLTSLDRRLEAYRASRAILEDIVVIPMMARSGPITDPTS